MSDNIPNPHVRRFTRGVFSIQTHVMRSMSVRITDPYSRPGRRNREQNVFSRRARPRRPTGIFHYTVF